MEGQGTKRSRAEREAPPVSALPARTRAALQCIAGQQGPIPQGASAEAVVQSLEDRAIRELQSYMKVVAHRCTPRG